MLFIGDKNRNRNYMIDVARGISIIYIVTGHCVSVFDIYLGLFHVSVFFYISGRLYNEKYGQSISSLIKMLIRRVKGLYIPFVAYNFVFILLHNFFYKIHFYHTPDLWPSNRMTIYTGISQCLKDIVKVFCFAHVEQLLAPFWFLPVLFLVILQFGLISYIINKMRVKKKEQVRFFIMALLFLTACAVSWKSNVILRPLQISWLGMIMYYMGVLAQKWLNSNKGIYNIYAAIICFVYIIVSKEYGSIGFAAMEISSPGFFIMCSMAGIYLTMCISYVVVNYSRRVKDILCVIGRSTIEIMALHYLSFKLISFVIILVYNYDIIYLGYPTIKSNILWQFLYLAAGVCLPLCFKIVINMVKQRLSDFRKGNRYRY